MARLARLVVPGMPHHVTQRGNRRQQTFFNDGDYAAYLELMAEWCREKGVRDLELLPDAQPRSPDRRAHDRGRLAAGHRRGPRRYTRRINFREKWRGYLWQGRFASFVMDEPYSAGGGALCGTESGAGGTCAAAEGLALEQCAGAPVGTRRSLGESRAAVGDDCGLEGLSGKRGTRKRSSGIYVGTAARVARLAARHSLRRLEATVGRVLKPQKRGPKPSANRKRAVIKYCVPSLKEPVLSRAVSADFVAWEWLFFLLHVQTIYAVRSSETFEHRFVLDCSLRCLSLQSFFDSFPCYDLLLRGLFGRSFQHATVPQPVPSWTPADRQVRPRSGAIRPTPIKSLRSSCGTPRRSIIRNTPGPRTRSRGHIELAGSRRDSLARKRRINTVTKVD